MIYVKSALAGVLAVASLASGLIVYRFLRPGPDVHLTDTFTYEVGMPWVRKLLPTDHAIAVTFRVFPDALVCLLVLLIFAAACYWNYRRISRVAGKIRRMSNRSITLAAQKPPTS